MPLLGGSNTHAARIFPPKLCEAIVRSIRKSLDALFKSKADTYVSSKLTNACYPVEDGGSSDEDEGEDPIERETLRPEEPRNLPSLTTAEKTLLSRTHVNLGHPATDLMLRVFRAAKARPEVLRYIQDEFSCPGCASHPRSAHTAKQQCQGPTSSTRSWDVTRLKPPWEAPSIIFLILLITERTIR